MTTEDAFLQAIRENPGDATPWQMYADWLEERGDPRAVFYREWRSTNSLGMTFVTVPRGTFWMGGGGGECGERQVAVDDFQIGIHPVTQGQWQDVMGNNPSWCSRGGEGKDVVKDVPDKELEQFPVEQVSWNDAQQFITKLNEREQRRGWLYRLPTEAEWEYACRGGATSKEECSFHFYLAEPSNDLVTSEANFNGNYPDTKDPYLEGTTKVGSYPPNRLGIYDMHGNVWEWCQDSGGRFGDRVLRGGNWYNDVSRCQASYRELGGPKISDLNSGFRLARVPSGH